MLKIFARSARNDDPWFGIELGSRVRDTITGFTGIVIARSDFLSGCNQVCVQPSCEKENELNKPEWLDIERIEKVSESEVEYRSRLSGADVHLPTVSGRRA